jgi:hypothetical protein
VARSSLMISCKLTFTLATTEGNPEAIHPRSFWHVAWSRSTSSAPSSIAAGSEVVFDVNESRLGAVRQVFPRRDNGRFKYLLKTLILATFHGTTALRNRTSRSTCDRFHVAISDVHRPFS